MIGSHHLSGILLAKYNIENTLISIWRKSLEFHNSNIKGPLYCLLHIDNIARLDVCEDITIQIFIAFIYYNIAWDG